MTTLVFNPFTEESQYQLLFTLPQNTVFKIDSDFETVLRRIDDYKGDIPFTVFPVTPGTDLFTMFGCNHWVITSSVAP